MIKEITAHELDAERFIEEKVQEIRDAVGDGMAINALSGGVDSSTVTMLGHRALGDRLKTVFIENGLMREGEPEQVVGLFRDARRARSRSSTPARSSSRRSRGSPTRRRSARPSPRPSTGRCFGRLVRESGAKYLLQGTILTDVDETVAGIKRQHNVFEQLGIDPQEAFGYRILEPLIQLRKDGVRKVGKALGLPGRALRAHPVPGAGARGARDRRGDPGAHRDGPQGHRRRRAAAQGHRRVPVHGDPARGPRDRHARREARFRPADRGALLGQRRRPDRHADPAVVRDPRERWRARSSSEVPGVVSVTYNIAAQAALDHRGGVDLQGQVLYLNIAGMLKSKT